MTQHQKCDKVRACVHAQMLCILRVFMFMSLYLLLMWFVSCLSSVLLSFFMLYLYCFRGQFSVVGGILFTAAASQRSPKALNSFTKPLGTRLLVDKCPVKHQGSRNAHPARRVCAGTSCGDCRTLLNGRHLMSALLGSDRRRSLALSNLHGFFASRNSVENCTDSSTLVIAGKF